MITTTCILKSEAERSQRRASRSEAEGLSLIKTKKYVQTGLGEQGFEEPLETLAAHAAPPARRQFGKLRELK